MNLWQDSVMLEHHVMECAFHHHDAGPKRKMLGGVSFDGGMTGSADKGRHTVSQAGEQIKQPPFSDVQFTDIGSGAGNLRTMGRGTSGSDAKGINEAGSHRRDTVSIVGVQDKKGAVKETEPAILQMAAAVEISDADKVANAGQPEVKHRYRLDYKKYIGKMKNGIQTFLKGMEQKAGKEGRQQPKKKEMPGTRTVTKEDVYEIQINTAYLLDSYNKYGERSVLGKE